MKRSDSYARFFHSEFLMGPNSVVLLDELLEHHPLHLTRAQTVLDLGCGKGLTSLFLANETGASVYANDLWISGEENRRRFQEWNVGACVTPSHEDATKLSFPPEAFDAIVSIDAYHYFAGEEGFFQQKILPFVKCGGCVLIVVPGIKEAYEGRQDALLGNWLGDEAYMFKSASRWRALIGESDAIQSARVWELHRFDEAWRTWLAVDSDFARGDREQFESVIEPYTCFVGIEVVKKA